MKNFYSPSKILMVLLLSISGIYKAQQSTLAAGTGALSVAGSVS